MNLKDISKQLPAKIAGYAGQLTITKRVKNGKYYCYYPFPTTEKENVPVVNGNNIETACRRMYRNLVDNNIIAIEKKKKKKKTSTKIKKPKTKEQIRKYKLTRQRNLLKSK